MDERSRLEQLNSVGRSELAGDLSPEEIASAYKARYTPKPTPLTHPQLFDPFNPPLGWIYDAHYEIWYKVPEGDELKEIAWVTAAMIMLIIMSFFLADYLRP